MIKEQKIFFLRNSFIYLFSNILNASVPFVLLPLFSHYFSTDDYGRIAMFQILIIGLNGIIGLNTVGAASRHFFENDNKHTLTNYNSSSFFVLYFSVFLILSICLLFSNVIVDFLSIPKSWVFLAVFCSFGTFIIQFKLVQLQIRKKALNYGLLQVSNSIINLSLTILFIVFMNYGVEGRVWAVCISTLFYAVFCFCSLKREKLLNFQLTKLNFVKDNLSFGLPLVPHVLGMFFLSSVDRFIINKKFGLSDAGIYMMAFQISLGLILVYDSINKAFVPFLFSTLKKNNYADKRKIVSYSYFLFLFCIFIGVLSFFISPYILNFVSNEKYILAASFIGLLCIGQSFQGLYLIVTNYIFYHLLPLYQAA